MTTPQERNRAFNRLLQDELDMFASYESALTRMGDDPQAGELRRIEQEHREAAHWLRQQILQDGGKPADGWLARQTARPISGLRLLFSLLVGGATVLFLIVVSGGILFTSILFAAVLFILGSVHYLLWGRSSERAAAVSTTSPDKTVPRHDEMVAHRDLSA